jgi:glycosyltransferase involved in cell wall biosynthesis
LKYSIVIPTYNRLDLLRPCLESVGNNTLRHETEVIVVSNGCKDGTREYLAQFGDQIKTIVFDEPQGYPKATNAGIRASLGDFVVLLNNDTVVLAPDWLDKLAKPMVRPSVGITGSLMHYSDETNRGFIVFFCAMIRRKVFETIGLLNEMFTPGFGEDMEYCWRAEEAGFELVEVDADNKALDPVSKLWITPFPLYHKGTATMDYKGGEIVKRNQEMLRALRQSREPMSPISSQHPVPKIVITDFVRRQNNPDSGRSYYRHSEAQLITAILCNWDKRKAGQGKRPVSRCCVVPMPPEQFATNTVYVKPTTELMAKLECREPGEEPYIQVKASRFYEDTVPCKFASVVLYHYDELTYVEREGKAADWYVVAIIASDVEDEPMHPTTMARNQLAQAGGTKVEYTSEEWARAVDYWRIRCPRAMPVTK